MREAVLAFCKRVDRINGAVGRSVRWLVLAIPIVTVTHGISRKVFALGSNHVNETQWYMLAAIFMLCAGYTLLRDEHVRIDFLSQFMPERARLGIDIALHLGFLVPICAYLSIVTVPFFWESFLQNEGPSDVVIGLPRWILKSFLPIGFALLGLQCLSEALKRIAYLRGWITEPPRAGGLFEGTTR